LSTFILFIALSGRGWLETLVAYVLPCLESYPKILIVAQVQVICLVMLSAVEVGSFPVIRKL
jgi:hypothetical protein